MSRYTLSGRKLHTLVTVGWDNPLATFFAHVEDQTIPLDQERIIAWVGTAPAEITTVQALETALAEYAEVPHAICRQLYQDYLRRTTPTPLQRRMVHLMQHGRTLGLVGLLGLALLTSTGCEGFAQAQRDWLAYRNSPAYHRTTYWNSYTGPDGQTVQCATTCDRYECQTKCR